MFESRIGGARRAGDDHHLARQKARSVGGLAVVLLLYLAILVWQIEYGPMRAVVPAPVRPLVLLATGGTFLAITAVALFARPSRLIWVAVPPPCLATLTVAYSQSLDQGFTAAAAILSDGALGVGLSLSLAAVAMQTAVPSPFRHVRTAGLVPLILSALGLLAIALYAASQSGGVELAVVFAAVAIIAIESCIRKAQKQARGLALRALMTIGLLSLGAIFVACISAGTSMLIVESKSSADIGTTMRLGWLSAIPLLFATAAGVLPRLGAVGLAIKAGPQWVWTPLIATLTSAGLLLAGLSELEAHRPPPESTASAPGGISAQTTPTPVHRAAQRASAHASAREQPVEAERPRAVQESDGAEADAGTRAPLDFVVNSRTWQARIQVDIRGPLAPKDARGGLSKAMRSVLSCYGRADSSTLLKAWQARLSLSRQGGVTSVELGSARELGPEVRECVTLSFYRTGFSLAPAGTKLHLKLTFSEMPH